MKTIDATAGISDRDPKLDRVGNLSSEKWLCKCGSNNWQKRIDKITGVAIKLLENNKLITDIFI